MEQRQALPRGVGVQQPQKTSKVQFESNVIIFQYQNLKPGAFKPGSACTAPPWRRCRHQHAGSPEASSSSSEPYKRRTQPPSSPRRRQRRRPSLPPPAVSSLRGADAAGPVLYCRKLSAIRFKLKGTVILFHNQMFETGCFQARVKLAPPHRVMVAGGRRSWSRGVVPTPSRDVGVQVESI